MGKKVPLWRLPSRPWSSVSSGHNAALGIPYFASGPRPDRAVPSPKGAPFARPEWSDRARSKSLRGKGSGPPRRTRRLGGGPISRNTRSASRAGRIRHTPWPKVAGFCLRAKLRLYRPERKGHSSRSGAWDLVCCGASEALAPRSLWQLWPQQLDSTSHCDRCGGSDGPAA